MSAKIIQLDLFRQSCAGQMVNTQVDQVVSDYRNLLKVQEIRGGGVRAHYPEFESAMALVGITDDYLDRYVDSWFNWDKWEDEV